MSVFPSHSSPIALGACSHHIPFALLASLCAALSLWRKQEIYSPPFGGVARIHARAARDRRRPSQLRRLLARHVARFPRHNWRACSQARKTTDKRQRAALASSFLSHYYYFFFAFSLVAIESMEDRD